MDLKQCINAVNTNQAFPGRREDFSNQQAYESWLAREKKYLQGLMTFMVTSSTLTLSTNSEQDVGSANLLSGNNGRRPSDSKRTSVYGSTNTDDVRIISLAHRPYFVVVNGFYLFYRVLIRTFQMILDPIFVF